MTNEIATFLLGIAIGLIFWLQEYLNRKEVASWRKDDLDDKKWWKEHALKLRAELEKKETPKPAKRKVKK